MNDAQRKLFARLHDLCKSLPVDEADLLIQNCADPEVRRELESQFALPEEEQQKEPGLSLSYLREAIHHVAKDFVGDDTSASSETLIAPDSQLGRYRILNRLGRGGMGDVFRAYDTRLNRMVAIKVLRGQYKRLLDHEARALAALSHHPHICVLYDVGSQDHIRYVVTEFLEGETLYQRLRANPGPLEGGHRIAVQLAHALGFVHRHGIVHRDLKPANIMLTAAGVKLLDFGIAQLLDAAASDGTLFTPGAIIGTPSYMSPEQLRGEAIDHRSDIFSFGAVLYEIFSGAPAFAPDRRQDPIPLRQLVTDLPAELERIIVRCLSTDAADRYPTMQQVKKELKNPRLVAKVNRGFGRPGSAPYTEDIIGTWISDDYQFQGNRTAIFKFKRYGSMIAGTVDVIEKKDVRYLDHYNVHGGISDVTIDADQISFTALMDVEGILGTTPAKYPLRFAGVISADRLHMAAMYKDGPQEFTAKKSTTAPNKS